MSTPRISRRQFTAGALASTTLGAAGALVPAGATAAPRRGHGSNHRYADVLDLHGSPDSAEPAEVFTTNVFADHGAWHAYALPRLGDHAAYGGFTGPLYIAQEYPWWLSRQFARVTLRDHRSGAIIRLADDPTPTIESLPGRLHQRFRVDGLTIGLELRFVGERCAMVQLHLDSRRTRALDVSWDGSLLRPEAEPMRSAAALRAAEHGIRVDFARVRETWDYLTGGHERFAVHHAEPAATTIDGDGYLTRLKDPVTVHRGRRRTVTWVESFTFDADERRREQATIERVLHRPRPAAEAVDQRWQRTVHAVTRRRPAAHRDLAVKALETLTTDWRSPAGQLLSDGITPSISYKWFTGGFWAWDSWKEAVGTVEFDPSLAISTIASVFDHQITADSTSRPQDAGMVPDAVFYNDPSTGGGNWNERNSKPPLAAWSVWRVHRATRDVHLLRRMYPRLAAFHQWWHRNRDHNHDGICEYGATVDPANDSPQQRLLAAAWESGMDNAPRFDAHLGAAMVTNTGRDGQVVGYSLNQQSVDLAAYLLVDARLLARMATMLGHHHDAHSYRREARHLQRFIRTHMYDERTGWFYDTSLRDGAPLVSRGMGIEGAIPLWAGAATRAQARAVHDHLMNPRDFWTKTPFPTVARSSPHFSPTEYWRGPNWLDQTTFAIHGLHRYGFHSDARRATARLLENADGLLGDAPIAENYNPLTGEAMNSTNFAWSASMTLLLTDPRGGRW